jgi:hypothetical protein
VEPSIALASGAEDNDLALWAAALVRANLQHTAALRRDFAAMRAAVAMVAPDRRLSITLRFDLGQLTVHDSMIGMPDVTLCGDYEVLMGLARLPIGRLGRLPVPSWSAPRERRVAWRRTAVDLLSGELKIYGLVAHPRLVTRLLRLLSQPPDAAP